MKVIQGNLISREYRFALVVSRFNEIVSQKLVDGAIDFLLRHNVKEEDIDIIWVPWAFEIPQVAKVAVQRRDIDAVICLGAVIRGSTPHFEYIASEVSKGIAQLALKQDKPVIFGVLTTDTLEQALERAGAKSGNKGYYAASAALEMLNLLSELKIGTET